MRGWAGGGWRPGNGRYCGDRSARERLCGCGEEDAPTRAPVFLVEPHTWSDACGKGNVPGSVLGPLRSHELCPVKVTPIGDHKLRLPCNACSEKQDKRAPGVLSYIEFKASLGYSEAKPQEKIILISKKNK